MRPTTGAAEPDETGQLARLAVQLLTASGCTVAVAESLTGGLVAAALTSVPGASAVLRGAVVAYATELKETLLGVPAGLLARRGAVDPDVAAAMAAGVRRVLGASYGVATTGVAGPGPADGKQEGTVFIAICGPTGAGPTGADPTGAGPTGAGVRGLQLPGGRQQVREHTVRQALSLLVDALQEGAG